MEERLKSVFEKTPKELGIIESSELPEKENVYLKKQCIIPFLDLFIKFPSSWYEWNVVYPIRDDKGKLIIKNFLFGGFQNLIRLGFYAFIIFLFFYAYKEILGQACQICDSTKQVIQIGS